MKKRTIKGWVRKLRQDGIRKRFLRWVISIVLSHHHLAGNGGRKKKVWNDGDPIIVSSGDT